MNKYCLLVLLILGMLALFGCSKSKDKDVIDSNVIDTPVIDEGTGILEPLEIDNKVPPAEPILRIGVYWMEYKEEIEGEEYTFKNYVIFNDDNTGYYCVNDIIPMTWTEESFTTDDDTEYKFNITSDETIEIVSEDGDNEVYKYSGPKIPEELKGMIDTSLDVDTRKYNKDAVEEFQYIIGSDSIKFYDYDGNVSYEATGEELSTVKAAYYEITDLRMPILFVDTPNAAHYAGYQHLLQYNEGTVLDIGGLDAFVELYKNSGVIVGTYQGGGYGEVNYYYYKLNDDRSITMCAYRSVMEDEEFAGSYKQTFGEDFTDHYELNDEVVDVDTFDSWLSETTGGETPVSPEYKPLAAVFK